MIHNHEVTRDGFILLAMGYIFIQLVAAKSEWLKIQPFFERMVRTLKFSKESPETDEFLKALQEPSMPRN